MGHRLASDCLDLICFIVVTSVIHDSRCISPMNVICTHMRARMHIGSNRQGGREAGSKVSHVHRANKKRRILTHTPAV